MNDRVRRIGKQTHGRLASSRRLNHLIDQINPILDCIGQNGVEVKKSDGRWVFSLRSDTNPVGGGGGLPPGFIATPAQIVSGNAVVKGEILFKPD